MEVLDLIEEFQKYLKIKGFSTRTINDYPTFLKVYDHFLELENIQKVTDITKPIQIKFQNYLFFKYKTRQKKTLSLSSQDKYISVVKSFFSFLVKNENVLIDTSVHLESPKLKKKEHRDILSKKEAKKLIDSITNLEDPIEYRNLLIIQTFLCTGVRASEICNLKIKDIDLIERSILIEEGKGGLSRYCVLTKKCAKILLNYLNQHRPKLLNEGDSEYLLLSCKGNQLSRQVLSKMVRRLGENAGIKKISPHSLRITVATLLASNNNVNIYYVQQLLGHKSIRTTEAYLGKSNLEKLRKILEDFHPLNGDDE